MARRSPPRGSWITCCLATLGLSFLVLLPAAGPQSAPAAFAAAAAKKVAVKEEAPSAPPPPKRPLSAYMIWLKEERPSIVEDLGTNAVPAVANEAGKRWNSLSQKAKEPFVDEAADLKEDYAGELEDFIAEYGAEAAKRKTKAKKVAKKIKDPNAPKRPLSSYMLWLQDNRSKLKAKLPSDHKSTEVFKLAGVEWGKVSAAIKTKYTKLAAEGKSEYEKEKKQYLASLAA